MSAYSHYPTPPAPHYTASSYTPQYYSPISSLVLDAVKDSESFTVLESIGEIELMPADKVKVDFPATNFKGGNTMMCLEQALLERFGLGNLHGEARKERLNDLRESVIGIKGKLLKAGDGYNSPVVADTYVDSNGKKYYKFLICWEIRLKNDPGSEEIVIAKKQWIITGIGQPTRFDDSSLIRYQHHKALLAIKTHLYIIKAAFNKDDRQHGRVLRCIEDVRQNDIIGPDGYLRQRRVTFTIDVLNVHAKKDPDSSYQLDNTIGVHDPALALCAVLRNGHDKKVCVYIDQASCGRKPNPEGTKLLKTPFNSLKPEKGIIPLCQKRMQQAHMMAVRGNPDLSRHIRILQAEPEELDELLKSFSFAGTNPRGMTHRQVLQEQRDAKKSLWESKQTQVIQIERLLIDALETAYKHSAGSRGKALSRSIKTSISKRISKEQCIENILSKLQGSHIPEADKSKINEALSAFRRALESYKAATLCLHKLENSLGSGSPPSSEELFRRYDLLIRSIEALRI